MGGKGTRGLFRDSDLRDQFGVEPRARGGTEEGERVCVVGGGMWTVSVTRLDTAWTSG